MMKMKTINMIVLLIAASLVFLQLSCEYDGPKAIWNPNEPLGENPAILTVDPADRAEPGVLDIKITGKYFSPDTNKNTVYFNNQAAVLKSFSVTSDSTTEIVVYRPNIFGNNLSVKVLVDSTYVVASQLGYGISEVARLYGNVGAKNLIQFLAADAEENLYAATSFDVRKIDTHEVITTFGTLKYNKKTLKVSDLKIGPDGALYIQTSKAKPLYLMLPSDSASVAQEYGNFAAAVSFFDFDKNGNAYGGGDKTGLCVLKPDLTSQVVGDCADLTILAVRVYNNAVYVATSTEIWRCPILGLDGTLGNKEMVMSITQFPKYAASKIYTFIMDEDGDFYVSTNHADAELIYHPNDGTIEPMYWGILIANGGQLVWGGGDYFYLNMRQVSTTNDIMRITTGKKAAPK